MMKSVTLIVCAAILTALEACTPAPIPAQPPVQRERLAYLKQTAGVPVICTHGADCAEKWAHAQEWVNRHSVYSIKTSTDNEIVTNGPIEPTTDSAFTISKSPQDANTDIITFTSNCGKAQACVPTGLELQSEFNNFLLYGTRDGNF